MSTDKPAAGVVDRARALLGKIPRRAISITFLIIILVFLALYLKSIDFHRLSQLHFEWSWLVLGSIIAVLYRFMAVYIWRVILRCLGTEKLPPFAVMSDVFAKAWMARYIPGTVTWVAGRIWLASAYGISKSRLTVSSLLEGGMQIVAGIVIAVPMIGFSHEAASISGGIKVLSVAISVACLLALMPPVFNRIMQLAYRALKRQKPKEGHELHVNGRAVWRSFLWFVLASFIAGAANFFVARAVDQQLGSSLFFYLVGAFSLAGAIGIATPFLPSGIGVRDGVILVLLGLIMPKDIALAITVLSRLWGVAVDAIFFAAATAWHRMYQRRSSTPARL